MKTLSLALFFIVASLFLNGVARAPQQQDPIKKTTQDTIKVKKMTDEQRKQMELQEWQLRSKRLDANMTKQQRQIAIMDSLLGKKDTTKIKK